MSNLKLQRKRMHGRRSIFTALFGPELHDICHEFSCHWNLLHSLICVCHHKHECCQQSFALLRLLFAWVRKSALNFCLSRFGILLGFLPLGIWDCPASPLHFQIHWNSLHHKLKVFHVCVEHVGNCTVALVFVLSVESLQAISDYCDQPCIQPCAISGSIQTRKNWSL